MGDRVKVRGKRVRGDLGEICFTQRMVGIWNSLPEMAVDAGTLTTIKKCSDENLHRHCIHGYGASAGKWDYNG